MFPEIARRLKLAGYDYARTLGKRFYATFYTDKVYLYSLSSKLPYFLLPSSFFLICICCQSVYSEFAVE